MSQQNFDRSYPDQLQGFPGLHIAVHGGSAFIASQGAQLLSWCGSDGRERLYLSSLSEGLRRGDATAALSAPLRGGVPVCFPQFSGRGPMLKHGFARGMAWQRIDGDAFRFAIEDSQLSRRHWPHAFRAQLTVSLRPDEVEVALEVNNRGSSPWSFTCALHTYFRVDDIRSTQLHGLQNIRYQDATAGNVERIQPEQTLAISGEIDRVYLSPPTELRLVENGAPALRILQQGFADTVVWNPGPENARALKDFPDADWLHMLCVEAAHAAAPVTLQPGETWRGSQSFGLAQAA